MIESLKKFIRNTGMSLPYGDCGTAFHPLRATPKPAKSAESQTYKKNILLKVVQQYYIEIWLMVQEKYECLTLPSDLYRTNYVSCPWAEQMAKRRVSKIEQHGHIDRNYKYLVNYLANSHLSVSRFIYQIARKRVLI